MNRFNYDFFPKAFLAYSGGKLLFGAFIDGITASLGRVSGERGIA